MRRFESFMAQNLSEYAAYRQQLGCVKKAIKPPLYAFDQYLNVHKATWEQLQPAFFLQMRADIRKRPNTVNNGLFECTQFFRVSGTSANLPCQPARRHPAIARTIFYSFCLHTRANRSTAHKHLRKYQTLPKAFVIRYANVFSAMAM